MGCGGSNLRCGCPAGHCAPKWDGALHGAHGDDRRNVGGGTSIGDPGGCPSDPPTEQEVEAADVGADGAERGKGGEGEGSGRRRRRGKARKAKNGARNGFGGVPRPLGDPGRKIRLPNRAGRPEIGGWREAGMAMSTDSAASLGPTGVAGLREGSPPAPEARAASPSSCEAFYTPTSSWGECSAYERPGGHRAASACSAGSAADGVISASGGGMSAKSPFELADLSGLAKGMWQLSDEELSCRVSSRRNGTTPKARRTAGPRREGGGKTRSKRSGASEKEWLAAGAVEEAITELRSFSASAGQVQSMGQDPGIVRSKSTNLSMCPERREELERGLQTLLFGQPVPPEVSQAVRGGPPARETSTLQLTNDETGAACINQYVIVRSLGQGSHGRVRVCLNALDGNLYAVKTIHRAFVPSKLQQWGAGRNPKKSRHESVDGILRELAVMKKLDHPNVVKLHEVIDPKGKENIVLITEFMEKGALLKRLDGGKSGSILFQRVPEANVREVFRAVCAGLDYLHYQGIVHGDLKPDNLLVAANGDVKIADFTCSRMVAPEHFTSGVYGTPAFHAPEVIAGDQYNPYAADIWALGVCIYCAVCGELPFTGPGIMSMYNKILACEVTYPEDLELSADVKDLISKIFVRDAHDRISMEDLMHHPFLAIEGVPQLVSLRERTNPPSVIEVSVVEEDDAIDRASAVSFIRAKLKKKRYKPNDTLFKQGNPATCLYFVLDGTVALVQKYAEHGLGDVTERSCSTSLVLDMDESFMMCKFPSTWEETAKEGVLHLQKHEVKALQKRRREAFLKGEQYEHSVGVRGPGQVVGAMEPGSAPTHPYSAVAQTTVTVLKLTEEDLQNAFKKESARNLAKMASDHSALGTRTPTPEGTESGTGTVANGATATSSHDLVDHSTSRELAGHSTSSHI